MKKNLIAAAVAASLAVPAFAQNVSLSGNIDFAYINFGGTQETTKGQTVMTTTGTSSTSVINIIAVEDLGGGMKAHAKYGIDPRQVANDSFSVTNNTGAADATATLGNTSTGIARDETFVGIESGLGTIRLGSPNSVGLTGFLMSSPLGTGVGSGYAPNSGTMAMSMSSIRYSRSVRYDSPRINGIQLQFLFAPGQDVAVTAPAATTAGAAVALPYPNARKTTEAALHYMAGPLTAQFTTIQQASQDNGTGYYAGGAATTRGLATQNQIVDAKFDLSSTTSLYAQWHKGNLLANIDATTNGDTRGLRIGAHHVMGPYRFAASYAAFTQDLTATTEANPKVMGARADYNLSKRSIVYLGYENWKTDRTYAATAATATGNRNITSLGLRHIF